MARASVVAAVFSAGTFASLAVAGCVTSTTGSSGETTADLGSVNPPTSPPAAPVNLHAFTGGTSIALRWSRGSAKAIARYDVFRDGTNVGSVKPGFHADFSEKDGNGFIDGHVIPGQTYRYELQAIDDEGSVSDKSTALLVTQPTSTTDVPTITLDASKAPDLTDWLRDTVKPFLEIWYPKICDLLARPGYVPTSAFSITLDPDYAGIAYTSGSSIVMSATYARGQPQDLGGFLHESTHVMQNYQGASAGWVTEGIADWTREYVLHDRDPVPILPGQLYTQGYSQGSYFLNWIQDTYGPNLIYRINVASHQGKYDDALFQQLTGSTLLQLWQQLTGETLSGPGPITFDALAGKCLDDAIDRPMADGRVQIWDCNGAESQRWTVVHNADATLAIAVGGRCLDVRSSGTSNGSAVQMWECNGTGAQKWRLGPSGVLVNPASGRCLDDPSSAVANGTELQLWDCSASSGQTVTLP